MVDCVVVGFCFVIGSKLVGLFLLGFYDDDGLFDYVGFCFGFLGDVCVDFMFWFVLLIELFGFIGKVFGGLSCWLID